ncbi:MAG TPA: hypothetical protein VGF67_21555 [Ktedonobacteraceae bacterium]
MTRVRLNEVTFLTQPLAGSKQLLLEMVQVSTPPVAQLHQLESIPDASVRMEIGSRAGQLLQVQPFGGSFREKGFEFLPPMDRRAISHEQALAGELTQKTDHSLTVRTCPTNLHEASAIKGHAAPGREMISCQLHPQDGRMPAWCPGAHCHRQQIQPWVIGKPHGSSLLFSFFLRRPPCVLPLGNGLAHCVGRLALQAFDDSSRVCVIEN